VKHESKAWAADGSVPAAKFAAAKGWGGDAGAPAEKRASKPVSADAGVFSIP
jgi:hypothetical protein